MSIEPSVRPLTFAAAEIGSVAERLVRSLDGALHASVAEQVDGVLTTLVTTDSLLAPGGAPAVGPTSAAWELGRIIRIPSTTRSQEWPELCLGLVEHGVFSVGAFPIRDPSGTVLGVLTVSSQDHHGFGAPDIVACRAAAGEIAVLIVAAG